MWEWGRMLHTKPVSRPEEFCGWWLKTQQLLNAMCKYLLMKYFYSFLYYSTLFLQVLSTEQASCYSIFTSIINKNLLFPLCHKLGSTMPNCCKEWFTELRNILAVKKETKPNLLVFITNYELCPDVLWSNKPFKGICTDSRFCLKQVCPSGWTWVFIFVFECYQIPKWNSDLKIKKKKKINKTSPR